jgi:hypothetical protein
MQKLAALAYDSLRVIAHDGQIQYAGSIASYRSAFVLQHIPCSNCNAVDWDGNSIALTDA